MLSVSVCECRDPEVAQRPAAQDGINEGVGHSTPLMSRPDVKVHRQDNFLICRGWRVLAVVESRKRLPGSSERRNETCRGHRPGGEYGMNILPRRYRLTPTDRETDARKATDSESFGLRGSLALSGILSLSNTEICTIRRHLACMG